MRLTDQEKLALAILRDPNAEEQLWLAACESLSGSVRKSRKDLISNVNEIVASCFELVLSVMVSFVSGIVSVTSGIFAGMCLTASVFVLTGTAFECFTRTSSVWCSGGPATLWCLAMMSLLLGFFAGITRRLGPSHIGFRTGLLMPIFSTVTLVTIYGMPSLMQLLGTWAYNLPLLSILTIIASYRFGAMLVNYDPTVTTEEKLVAKPVRDFMPGPIAVSSTAITISGGNIVRLLPCHKNDESPYIIGLNTSNDVRLSAESFRRIDSIQLRVFVEDQQKRHKKDHDSHP